MVGQHHSQASPKSSDAENLNDGSVRCGELECAWYAWWTSKARCFGSDVHRYVFSLPKQRLSTANVAKSNPAANANVSWLKPKLIRTDVCWVMKKKERGRELTPPHVTVKSLPVKDKKEMWSQARIEDLSIQGLVTLTLTKSKNQLSQIPWQGPI